MLSTAEAEQPGKASRYVLTISSTTRDIVFFALWCTVTFTTFRGDELILYPLAGYYAYAFWRDQRKILPLIAKCWPIILFPMWCVLSPIWAVDPFEALKYAAYLTLTIIICFQVAAGPSPRQIVYAMLLAVGTIGVINILYALGPGDFSTGIFPQKNFMGKNMVVLWILSTLVSLDRGSPGWLRLTSAGLAVIALVMAFSSKSATAIILVLATGAIVVTSILLLRGGLLKASRIAAASLALAVVVGIGAVVLPTFQGDPVDEVLDHFDKDTTLTGRTVLWEFAEKEIAENPWLGLGPGGFWRYHDSPTVRQIYEEFHKNPRDYFNFHNSFYEIAVHLGLVGAFLAMLALVWALFQIIRAALVIGDIPQIYFMTHASTVLVRTFTEADFLRPFVLFHMIFWIGAILATIKLSEHRARMAAKG